MSTFIGFKLTEYDLACMAALQETLGLPSRAAVLREGYRALAASEKVQLPARKKVVKKAKGQP